MQELVEIRELCELIGKLCTPSYVDKSHAVKNDGRDAGDRKKGSGRTW